MTVPAGMLLNGLVAAKVGVNVSTTATVSPGGRDVRHQAQLWRSADIPAASVVVYVYIVGPASVAVAAGCPTGPC